MKFFFIIASSVISVLHAYKVIQLNSDNFDKIVDGSRNVFVKFEASWCGPCKALAPILDEVAKNAFPNLNGDTIIAKIDADTEYTIADRFNIEFFPTLKLFLKGRPQNQHIDYDLRSPQNVRKASAIAKFIQEQVESNIQSLPGISSLKPSIIPSLESNSNIDHFVGPRGDFISGSFSKSEKYENQQIEKSGRRPAHKPKKHTTHRNADRSPLPSVDAQTAKNIIANAGSKPVILIFYSPSTQHTLLIN